jgi:hypothetical protein
MCRMLPMSLLMVDASPDPPRQQGGGSAVRRAGRRGLGGLVHGAECEPAAPEGGGSETAGAEGESADRTGLAAANVDRPASRAATDRAGALPSAPPPALPAVKRHRRPSLCAFCSRLGDPSRHHRITEIAKKTFLLSGTTRSDQRGERGT